MHNSISICTTKCPGCPVGIELTRVSILLDVLRRGLAAVVVNKLVERGQTEAMNRAVAFDNSGSFCLPVHWEEMNPDEPASSPQ